MVWLLVPLLVAVPIWFVLAAERGRRAFDDTRRPADDLRRADDGGLPSLGMRDGTGGLV